MLKTKNDNLMAYLFMLPALFIFSVFVLYPFINGFIISLHEWDGLTDLKFIGWQNYINLFKDSMFYSSFLHNLLFALGTVISKVAIGLITAILLNQQLKGIIIYRTIFITPVVMSFVAVGLLWSWIFNPMIGLFNAALMGLKIITMPIAWLGEPQTALLSIIIVDIWKWSGYHTVLFLAGLQTIPPELYEAAEVDGASAWGKFRYITIPQLKSMIIINTTIALMGAFNVFDLIFIMTQGGPYGSTHVLSTYMYETSFRMHQYGYGTTIAYVLFIIIFAISAIQVRRMRLNE